MLERLKGVKALPQYDENVKGKCLRRHYIVHYSISIF